RRARARPFRVGPQGRVARGTGFGNCRFARLARRSGGAAMRAEATVERFGKPLPILAGFAALGVLAAIQPLAAAVAAGSAVALAMFFARPRWLRFVAIGLVLVPSLGMLRSTASAE